MPLRACMKAHTHREYLTWLAWLDKQWNTPDLICHYLMQVAQEVRRTVSKKPKSVLLSWFRIPFERKALNSPPKEIDKEEATKRARARFGCFIKRK